MGEFISRSILMTTYDWGKGEFNPSCVCGGSVDQPNEDCERCMMVKEIERLKYVPTTPQETQIPARAAGPIRVTPIKPRS